MKALQQLPNNQSAQASNGPNAASEFFQEPMNGDMSQGSEYLDDAIRMVDQPLKIPRQNIQE